MKINNLFDKHPTTLNLNQNIKKIDSIYLTVLPNKKFADKIVKDPFFNDDDPKYLEGLSVRERKLQKFLLDLEGKKKILSSQEKSNMNEKFKPYSVFKYKLNERSEDIYKNTRDKFAEMMENIKGNESFSLKNIKDELDKLFNDCNNELSKMEYKLDDIDIMSISEVSDKIKSIPLVLLELENKEGIIYRQVKGEIVFHRYNNIDDNSKKLKSISAKYYF